MQTTIKTNTTELDLNFLDAVRKLFKDQDIEISIRNLDETEYLMSNEANRRHLMESIAEYERKETATFTLEDFFEKYGKSNRND